jgi:hypothetical protein
MPAPDKPKDQRQEDPPDDPAPARDTALSTSSIPRAARQLVNVPEPSSVVGIRVALSIQMILTLIVGPLFYPIVLGFSAMVGSTTADTRDLTMWFIFLTVVPASLHLLAAIQIGRARWGGKLVGWSMAVAGIQILIFLPFLFALPFLIVAAAPFIIALICEIVAFCRIANRKLIEAGSAPKRAALPEAIVVPTALAILVGLLVGNSAINNVENRHPAREFDSSQSDERLESALDPVLPVLAEVEGMPEPIREYSGDTPCSDGAGGTRNGRSTTTATTSRTARRR